MKPRKNTTLIMLLGLLLFAFTAGTAQTPAQGDQKKKAEACCAMESCCCCSGDSCQMMKKDGATSSTAMANTADKKDSKHSCCSGDSCKMKTKEMNHTSDDHACCSCCGDSCDVNMKHDGATMKHDMKDHKGDCCKAKSKSKKAA